jgi:hypothetical protein
MVKSHYSMRTIKGRALPAGGSIFLHSVILEGVSPLPLGILKSWS